ARPALDGMMTCVSDDDPVTDNQAASRFEIQAGGHLAELFYHRNGNRLALIHTEGPVEFEGRRMGGPLGTAAGERAAAQGVTTGPYCRFARGWLERHPDVAGQVSIDWRAA